MLRPGRAYLFILFFLALSVTQAQQPRVDAASPRMPRLDHRFVVHAGGTHAWAAPAAGSPAAASSLPDTVRVLALMVDFQDDDDERTSGTGKFGTIYEYDYGTEILDPLPHDRQYFRQHLRFLENYVRKSSGWKTILTGAVLDGIVTMPKKLGEYSFRKDESEVPVAQLAVDAWTLAGQQFPETPFGDYHMFVIFHAGRGRDIDLVGVLGYDPTPLDIPSLSFTRDGFRRLLGASFDGIPMPDGSRIDNCAVLPTTNIREIPQFDGSTGLLEITINGLLAASFGTYAGLPDLFDTKTGKTGIGRFGLMDGEGIFAYGGIAPPEPSAWEKQQLGWTLPREAVPGKQNYLLTSSDTLSTPDVLRVSITNREYWLLENRQRDRGGDGQLVTFVSGGQVQQVRFPKDTLGFENSNVQQLKGVIIDVEDYDWALPGGRVVVDDRETRVNGGILVWHVDETIITEHQRTNTVNTGKGPRGVDLEQAGGPQDIGVDIQTVFGTETGSGSALDYWSRENLSPVYTNRFDAYTSPNSRANSGAFTHVTIDNFSVSGPIMTLDVALGDNTIAPANGWPVDVATTTVRRTPGIQTADLDGDGAHEILVTFSSPSTSSTLAPMVSETTVIDTVSLFIYRQDGTAYLPSGALAFRDAAARFASPVVVGDWNGDGSTDIALVTRDSTVQSPTRLWMLAPTDTDGDGMLDLQRRIDHDEIWAMPALIGGRLVYRASASESQDKLVVLTDTIMEFPIARIRGIATPDETEATRRILALDERTALLTDGGAPGEKPIIDILTGESSAGHVAQRTFSATTGAESPALTAAAGDMDGDGMVEAIVTGAEFTIRSKPEDTQTITLQLTDRDYLDPARDLRHAAMADVDGDGRLDAVLSGSTAMRAVNLGMSTVDEYPVPHALRYSLSAALGSGSGHAVFGVGDDRLWQFITGARQADGFPVPLPAGSEVVLFPSVDGRLSIAVAAPEGTIFVFRTGNPITAEQLLWRARNGDERNSCAVTRAFAAAAPRAEFFPPERCYNWPNPVRAQTTYIRLYVSEASNVTVKIYDLAGGKVAELTAQIPGGTDTDIPWDVSDIQSDTYLAHVEATAGGKTGEKIIKIAVVK
ncbi:MAG: hypothetical protein RBU27_07180 [Bacteroidota bacterium]|jgi:hypothetical protein|nr:hypothetical protein [Bacteroidota bacterium]